MDLLARAQAGDGEAFGQLVNPYRLELQVHCYRILGSVRDAEDALQDTLLSAWQGLAGFEGRSSVRTWLYRVATSRCLDALRSAKRRPLMSAPTAGLDPPEPTRMGEVLWLEPYPDVLLEGLPDSAPGPDARLEAREAISLAFITALQLLPPRQRTVLILRDVLGFHASETAQILDTSQESVTSALKRARAALHRQSPAGEREPPPPPNSAAEQELVERFTRAFETADVDGVVALLTDDAWLTMPPIPLQYQGRELAARFLTATAFRRSWTSRLIAAGANGQPAFGFYVRDPQAGVSHAIGLLVLTLSGSRISALTRFDNSLLPRFGLPRTLPE
ncbi:MAG: sigma-70 family RNA polymerase sigma factor [Streptosporangiaceae bacterium]|jgi:RNA polymerase sigma-70 factor (ECF subfamily)